MLFLVSIGLWGSISLSFVVAAGIIGMPAFQITDLIAQFALPVAIPFLVGAALVDILRQSSIAGHDDAAHTTTLLPREPEIAPPPQVRTPIRVVHEPVHAWLERGKEAVLAKPALTNAPAI